MFICLTLSQLLYGNQCFDIANIVLYSHLFRQPVGEQNLITEHFLQPFLFLKTQWDLKFALEAV